MRNAPLLEAGRSGDDQGRGTSFVTVAPAQDKAERRCTLCPLCRCHHDCRPEPAEAVSGRG